MAKIQLCYCKTAMAGPSDRSTVRHAVPAFGPPIYNAAGDAWLCAYADITDTIVPIAIPQEAIDAGASIRLEVIEGNVCLATGLEGDTFVDGGPRFTGRVASSW